MEQEFLRPRLVGNRFSEHSLPFDLLKDFAALEEMIIEVAKAQYLIENPNRKRIPKGFTKGLELHLSKIEEGSTFLVISLMYSTIIPLGAENHENYFEKAKNQIIESIAAGESHQPPSLPPELLRYFDRFGRGLYLGESIEFERQNGESTALTPEVRERLLRASQAEQWTEEVTLRGRIPAADQDNCFFELELHDKTKLKAPLLESHRKTVIDAFYGYKDGALVSIKGIVKRDRAHRYKSFEEVEHITSLDPLDIESRLDDFKSLKHGWLEGKGVAPNHQVLEELAILFDTHYSLEPYPYLYPTAEGGVQAEWTLGSWEVSLEINFPELTGHFQALNLENLNDIEFDLSLHESEDWKRLNNTISDLRG